MVTMMARSITVERSVPGLPGLARVSGLGMGTQNLYSGWNSSSHRTSRLPGGASRVLAAGRHAGEGRSFRGAAGLHA